MSVQLLKDAFFSFLSKSLCFSCRLAASASVPVRCAKLGCQWIMPFSASGEQFNPLISTDLRIPFLPPLHTQLPLSATPTHRLAGEQSSLAGGDELRLHPVRQTVGALSGGQSSSISTP